MAASRLRAAPAFLGIGALFSLALPGRAAKTLPAAPPSYVFNEGVVSPAAEQRLSLRLSSLEERTGRQFVVALFESLEGEDLEDYSNRLFRAWRIGSRKRDDGLLFCLFKRDRRWRVEVGYGLEPYLTDLEASEIVGDAGAPRFKAGDLEGGVLAAVDALASKLEALPAASGAGPEASLPGFAVKNLRGLALELAGILGGFFFVFWIAFERGFEPGLDYMLGRRSTPGPRYPLRVLFIFWLYVLLLFSLLFELLRLLAYASLMGGGGVGGAGGFSGGGGSSGGGGASGSW